MRDLAGTAAALVAPGKGILAADEGVPAMPAPLARAGTSPTGVDGPAYQEMLVTTPALSTGISGVILRPETWAQRITDGTRFPVAVRQRGMLPGVKADKGLTPLLMDGSHSLAQCEAVTSIMLLEVVTVRREYDIAFDRVLPAPSLVPPGGQAGEEASADKVAEATIAALACLPAALAGVAFLSGGQRPEQATATLAALQATLVVWPLTFCFGRALTGPAPAAWQGTAAGVAAGQRALARRTALNVTALERRYAAGMAAGPGPAHDSRPGPGREES